LSPAKWQALHQDDHKLINLIHEYQRSRSMNRREAIAGIAGITAAVAASRADAESSEGTNPDLTQIRALLRAHDEAFTNHDLNGIMACLTKKAAIMGSGPGEIWSGPDEIKVAYEHFFEGFDKGQQKFEYQFRIGGVTPEMGWMMTAGNVNGKKDGKEFAFPVNLSLTVAKKEGKWLIAAMHFSTLTGASNSGTKASS
jgi:ketosteroid isomerase-like protein